MNQLKEGIKKTVDINADLGEFCNAEQLENELKILKYISSSSIACSGHIGDSKSIRVILEACKINNIAVGPHPSYPDQKGFGRNPMNITLRDLESSLREQIQLFFTVANSMSMPVTHVKFHGQLYNEAAQNKRLGNMLINMIYSIDQNLSIIGPANSLLEFITKNSSIPFISEAFIDRRYQEDSSLVNRNQGNALIESIQDQVHQARSIVIDEKVMTVSNKNIKIKADTLCIHGDNQNSLNAVKAVSEMLKNENIQIHPPFL